MASAGTSAVTVTPCRSMAAKAASGLGSVPNTMVPPTVIARVRDWLDIDHALVADLFATRTVADFAERQENREAERGTPQRLAVIARHYLEIAALTDEEVLAEG